jgi:hypothetical protein
LHGGKFRAVAKGHLDCFHQFSGINGLGYISIRSGGEAAFAVALDGVRGEGNDRSVRARGQFLFADERRSLQTIHLWHLHVHQNHIKLVRPILFPALHGFPTFIHGRHSVTLFLQQFLREHAIDRVVFRKKNVQLASRVVGKLACEQEAVRARDVERLRARRGHLLFWFVAAPTSATAGRGTTFRC